MDSISSVIRHVKDINDSKKVEIDGFEPICALRFSPNGSEVLIKICVDLKMVSAYINASDNVVNNFFDAYNGDKITDEDIPLTFFDYFGVGPHFKTFFQDIKDATILSKKDVSKLLRSDVVCKKTPDT